MPDAAPPGDRVLKYGIGYRLIARAERGRLYLGIACATCGRVSFNVRDVDERYCGACHTFHADRNPAEA